MASIRVEALGPLRVIHEGEILSSLPRKRRRCAVLVRLAVERSASRDDLLNVIWPDKDPERARNALKQMLYELRLELGSEWVSVDGEQITVGEHVTTDVGDFLAAAEQERFAEAVELDHGDFLSTHLIDSREFEEWTERVRRDLKRARVRVRRGLVEALAAKGKLQQAVHAARAWVDLDPLDDEAQHTLIELLARRGHRAEALEQFEEYERLLDTELEVRPLDQTLKLAEDIRSGEQQGSVERLPPPPPSPWERTRAALYRGLNVLGLAGIGTIILWLALRPPPPPLDPNRLAVLDFQAQGGGDAIAAFASNLAGRLREGLGAIDALHVVSSAGVAAFAARPLPADSVARSLNVGMIIDGAVEGYGDSLRVRIRLIDGATGTQLSTSVVEAAFPDRLGLMNEVADGAIAALRSALGPIIEARRTLLQTSSVEAYDLVLRAIDASDDGVRALSDGDVVGAQRGLDLADSLLTAAEQVDREWAEPTMRRGWLAQFYVQLDAAMGERSAVERLEAGIEHAERALRREPTSQEALELRGRLRLDLWSSIRAADPNRAASLVAAAEEDLRRAVGGNPQRGRVYKSLSELFAATGRLEQALLHAERAYEADPYLENFSAIVLRLFEYSFALERDAQAAEWCREGANRLPNEAMWYHCELRLLAWSDVAPPDPNRAWELRELALGRTPPPLRPMIEPNLDGLVAGVLARASLHDSALAVAQRLTAVAPQTLGTVIPRAAVLAEIGAPDVAIAVLREHLDRSPTDTGAIRSSRELRRLRGSAEFGRLFEASEDPLQSPSGQTQLLPSNQQ